MVKLVPVAHDPFATAHGTSPVINNIAAQGRNGDTLLAHVTPGDIAIPAEEITSDKMAGLQQLFPNLDISKYTAGSNANSINPKTGALEFSEGGGGGDSSGGDSGDGGAGSGGAPGNGPGPGGSTPGTNGPSDTGNTGTAGGLTGTESTTAVESGQISGTPVGTVDSSVTGLTGTTSETATETGQIPGTPMAMSPQDAVSNTTAQTGMPGVINDLTNFAQSKLTAFQNDPFGIIGSMAINALLGIVTGGLGPAISQGIGIANTALGITTGNTVGSLTIDGIKDAIASMQASGALGPPAPGSNNANSDTQDNLGKDTAETKDIQTQTSLSGPVKDIVDFLTANSSVAQNSAAPGGSSGSASNPAILSSDQIAKLIQDPFFVQHFGGT